MPGRLGLDFGTSNTVLAAWDEERQDAFPLHVPDFSSKEGATINAALIPSLIHYTEDNRRWIGEQVRERGLEASDRTFCLMKRYIAHRSPVARKLSGRSITFFEAGKDFLTSVLLYARQELRAEDEEIALTVPVESFEDYVDWLGKVGDTAGLKNLRFIDEPSAAALGYGAHIQPGQVYMIFDFGGGTLDVSSALIEEEATTGKRCRILGKAGRDLGGSTIDQWLFQDILKQAGRNELDEDVRRASAALLTECRRAKELLSIQPRVEVKWNSEQHGLEIAGEFCRSRLEEIMDEHDAFAAIDQTIRRALNSTRERGYSEEDVRAVFMVGGTSLVPCVERTVQRIFGKGKVKLDRPMDAVARGAAAFASGRDFYDHIQHDYAVRWTNPQKGGYDYRVIVKKGTQYPTTEPLARITIKATHHGQSDLGIAIFELGNTGAEGKPVELIFDPAGAARTVTLNAQDQELRSRLWVNESSPLFLKSSPPARAGEPRFTVEFGVDANKRLLINARDIRDGSAILRDFPVIKLR